ncbi:dihydroneopterin aldolase [Salinactinospora qingdaonensis]|uniref:7,8-dihydroneopterin aldolase n=1 Tax=Salinactinospora qingdaonensis TaxID=702744 RepID=A0ABP7G794_9ACTN
MLFGRRHRKPYDRIALHGLRGYGFHGVFDHERQEGQEFVVDVVLSFDTRAAARTDDVRRTVDYGILSDQLIAVIEGARVDLIETLADRIATVCLDDPFVREVEVTVHKPQAPIPHPFDDVTVTIQRRRP